MRQKTTEVEELTWLKLGEAVFVLVGYTIDPARNGKTNSQHIPDTEEYMTEDQIHVLNKRNQDLVVI